MRAAIFQRPGAADRHEKIFSVSSAAIQSANLDESTASTRWARCSIATPDIRRRPGGMAIADIEQGRL